MSKREDLMWASKCERLVERYGEAEANWLICKDDAVASVFRGHRLIDAALVRVLREAPRGLVVSRGAAFHERAKRAGPLPISMMAVGRLPR